MREIFTELYKKVLGFFQAQEKESATKDVAYNRLKLVLMQDRTNLTPFLLEKMRGEMINVLSKYVEMDTEALELNFEQEGDQMALMLSIPVLRAKDEEEIQAMLNAEEEAKVEETTESTELDENEVEAEVSEEEPELEPVAEAGDEIDEESSEEEDVCACGPDCPDCDYCEDTEETEETDEKPSSQKSKKKN